MIYILADIHANLNALTSIFKDMKISGYNEIKDKVLILGDLIDYGMRPNEVIDFIISNFKNAIILEGNHENAILNGKLDRFSSDSGRQCSQYTRSILTENSLNFIKSLKVKEELIIKNKKVLLVHGSIDDYYWGKINNETNAEQYSPYDVVLSAHTHHRHLFTKFIHDDNKVMRNKKAILFCNPGSVGQPRNCIIKAQYCVCDEDLENFNFKAVEYDIKGEQDLFNGETDNFYKDRISLGV